MKNYLFFLWCAIGLPAQAQESITPPNPSVLAPEPSNEPEFALDELIRRAQENSPRVQVAVEGLNAARYRSEAARARQSPTLQLVPGLGGTREARDEEVILAQPLDVFGLRRARGTVAAAELRRAQAENNLARRALIVEVKNAAIALFTAQEAEYLEQVQVEIAQRFFEAATRRAELGDVPPIQGQRAELELLRRQNDLSNAQAERLTRRALINQLVGQLPNTPLRVALPLEDGARTFLHLPFNSPSILESNSNIAPDQAAPAVSATVGGVLVTEDLSRSNSAVRPDIASAQATLELRQAEARAIRREILPAVELQARRSTFFGRAGSYAVRAVVTLPLFDFGALKSQRRAAEAEARAQAAVVNLLEQQAGAQIESARVRVEQNQKNVARYREKLLPLTLDLLRKTQIGYAQGVSTYLEVLEAQRTVRQMHAEYLAALVGVQAGETALEAATLGGVASIEIRPESNVFTMRGGSR